MGRRGGRTIVVIERSQEPDKVPWWVAVGAWGATGAVFGGIAWAVAWLKYEGKNPRLDVGKWIAGGTILGGVVGIIYVIVDSAVF